MLYNVLASSADKLREVGLGEAALYALLGFLIVFIGIAFLILIVWLVGKAMGRSSGTVKTNLPKVEEKAAASVVKEEELTEETVAVITAALIAYYEQANVKCEFTVKRIKRI